MVLSLAFDAKLSILELGGSTTSALIASRFGDASPFQLSALLAAGLVLVALTFVVNTGAAVRVRTTDDTASLVGSLVAGAALGWLLADRVLPTSRPAGALVLSYLAFLAIYSTVSWVGNPTTVVADGWRLPWCRRQRSPSWPPCSSSSRVHVVDRPRRPAPPQPVDGRPQPHRPPSHPSRPAGCCTPCVLPRRGGDARARRRVRCDPGRVRLASRSTQV